MGVFLLILIGFKKNKKTKNKTKNKNKKKTTKQKQKTKQNKSKQINKPRTATQLCAKLTSKLMWNNYFNVYLCQTYRWQRILNHCDIDGISYCRILLLTNTRTCTNATTFSVENRLLGNKKSGRGFALSDADTLLQSNQASFSWTFALFFDTSFQRARLNFSHWKNTEKNGTFSLFETSQWQRDVCIHYDVSLSQRITNPKISYKIRTHHTFTHNTRKHDRHVRRQNYTKLRCSEGKTDQSLLFRKRV